MYVVINGGNVVYYVVEQVGTDELGRLKVANTVYPDFTAVSITAPIPVDFKPGKYLFSNGAFSLNPNYVERVDPESLDALNAGIVEAENLTLDAMEAVAELYEALLMGGVL